jgi:Cdc6-like AAA superfamily ATPase
MLINVRDQRQKEIIDKLSDIDPYTKHRTMQAVRLAGTGSWTFPQFDGFLTQDSPFIMVCTGIAGSGKSVLTSQLFDRALEIVTTRHPLLWYCDYGDKRTLDPCNIIRNLCQQCMRRVEECPEEILIEAQKVSTLTGIEHIAQLVTFFSACLKVSSHEMLFLDGLDELPEREQRILLRTLYKVLGSEFGQIRKLYVASREDPCHIAQATDGILQTSIIMQESALASDMQSFVRRSVTEAIETGALYCNDALLPTRIIEALIEGSKGM